MAAVAVAASVAGVALFGPAPVREALTDPFGPRTVLSQDFDGASGVFADQDVLWKPASAPAVPADTGWFAESGVLHQADGSAWSDSDYLRLWTERTDLPFATVEMDVRFDGWRAGDQTWHGVNVWLNEDLCTPAPSCSTIGDRQGAGPSGYALDFLNRDGRLTIQKKVHGDRRAEWPGSVSHSNGGTYYTLAETDWAPQPGRTYRFEGSAESRPDGSVELTVRVDGERMLTVVDDGSTGGPVLDGGRVGVRSDFAKVRIDRLSVLR